MPTIDINTQRNSGGIGNAWDFWDIQRVWSASDRWSLVTGRHTLQAGVEYRRISLDGEFMARTNGDLDYDNWVLFFTGHGASGGGSDLDQGDTRRDFAAQDVGGVRAGRLAARRRPDGERRPALRHLRQLHRAERPHRQLLPARRRRAARASQPGFQVPGNSPFFQPGFTPLSIGLYVGSGHADRPQPDSRSEVRLDGAGATSTTSRRASASRGSRRLRRSVVVRGGWGIYYERTGASYKRDLQLSAPFFFYQNVPVAGEHGRSVSAAQRQPVRDSARRADRARRQRRAELAARRRHAVPGDGAVQREEQHLHRSAAAHAVPAAVDDERAVRTAPRVCCSTSATSARAARACSARSTWPCRSIRA